MDKKVISRSEFNIIKANLKKKFSEDTEREIKANKYGDYQVLIKTKEKELLNKFENLRVIEKKRTNAEILETLIEFYINKNAKFLNEKIEK